MTHRGFVRITGSILVVLALGGCGSDGGSEPSAIFTAEAIAGSWTFTLSDESANCSGASGGGDISVRLSGTSADVRNNKLNFPADDWGGDVTTTFGQITGMINLRTGALGLRVWKGVLVNGATLAGTVAANLTFTGTLQDPFPGHGPIFVFGSCLFQVTGNHD